MTECTQEIGGLCALLSVVFAVCTEQGKGSGSTQAGIALNTDVTRREGIPEYEESLKEAMCRYVNCGFDIRVCNVRFQLHCEFLWMKIAKLEFFRLFNFHMSFFVEIN